MYHACPLPRSDERPAYTGSGHTEGIPGWTFHSTSNRRGFNGVWIYLALQQTYKRDAKAKSFNGISQQPAAMEKYVRALPVLTAESEQTKEMTHLDLYDTKHHMETPTGKPQRRQRA